MEHPLDGQCYKCQSPATNLVICKMKIAVHSSKPVGVGKVWQFSSHSSVPTLLPAHSCIHHKFLIVTSCPCPYYSLPLLPGIFLNFLSVPHNLPSECVLSQETMHLSLGATNVQNCLYQRVQVATSPSYLISRQNYFQYGFCGGININMTYTDSTS